MAVLIALLLSFPGLHVNAAVFKHPRVCVYHPAAAATVCPRR